jgi:serine/threonine protein kinase/Tfp pilus assembly protein PilF
MLEIGHILDLRYEIIENIGKGGMGEVYKAIDNRLNVPVAVKLISRDNEEAASSFHREAQLLSNLRHANLPQVTDYIRNEKIQYLVMEFIEGEDLQKEMEQRKAPFSPEEVMLWTKQLLNVLGYLHKQGIHHRDIKPSNIKVRDGRVFLLDFGIAFGQLGEMSTKGVSSFFWHSGTDDFCPFEQSSGEVTTPASDLFSLAATLYFLLTGAKPETATHRFQKLVLDKIDPLKDIRGEGWRLDPHFAAGIMAALALDVNRRPQTAVELYWLMFPVNKPVPVRPIRRQIVVWAGAAALLIVGLFSGFAVPVLLSGFSLYQKDPIETDPGSAMRADKEIEARNESISLASEALSLQQSSRYEEAKKKAEAALAKDSRNVFARFVYGDLMWDTLYDDADSYAEMTKVQEQADAILDLMRSPETAEEYTARSWANLAKERYDLAVADATKAIELKPDFPAAFMIRGSAYSFIPDENNKSFLKAFDDFDKTINLMPNYAQAWANRANAYFALGKTDWAVSDFTEAIRLSPAARYYNDRGQVYYSTGKYVEARQEFQKALELDQKLSRALAGIGDSYFMEEDWKNAIKYYSQVIEMKSGKPNVLRNRGIAYGALREFNKAIRDFSRALESDKKDSLAYQYRAVAYYSQEKWEKALSDLSFAIDYIEPSDSKGLGTLYKYRASVYRELGDENKARRDEKRARALE